MKETNTYYSNFQWVNLENPKLSELSQLGIEHGLSDYLLKDLLQVGHLPKFEKVGDFNFLILRAYSGKGNEKSTTIPELSSKIGFFYTDNFLLTVHHNRQDLLTGFSEEFKDPESFILKILEKILNTYHYPANYLSDKMDNFEADTFLKNGIDFSVEHLYYAKAKGRACKKVLLMTQTLLHHLQVKPVNAAQLQDLEETVSSLLLQFEDFLDEGNSLLNIYLSSTSQRTNDVMKLLTVFSAFFLPLSFIVGFYGMNFDDITGLHWENGYYFTLGLMLLTSIIIFGWFKGKNII